MFVAVNLLLLFVCAQVSAQSGYGVLRAEMSGMESSLHCITYDPMYSNLPSSVHDAMRYRLQDLTSPSYQLFCNPSVDLPSLNESFAVAVTRGNCSFGEKAILALQNGAGAVVVISQELSSMMVNLSANGTSHNFPVVMLTESSFQSIMKMGSNAVVSLYSPELKRAGINLLMIWLLAVVTVTVGAYWSGLHRHRMWLAKLSMTSNTSPQRQNNLDVEMSLKYILIAVVMMCLMLLGLYFFYDYLVYVIIFLFALASSLSLQECISAICHQLPIPDILWCRLPSNRIPLLRQKPFVIDIIVLLISLGIAVWWVIERHSSYAWILQDILGIVFCIKMMTAIRLASLKTCAIMLILLFFYDIFFVFITPLLTKNEHSIMIDVATGAGSKSQEMLPMVIIVPNIRTSDAAVCMRPYSLLGFGDILVPGLLVSFCHGFDLQVNSRRVYYISNVFAYAAGLLVTDLALILTGRGQPALLYLVPFTLITTVIVAWQRRELRQIWSGKPDVMIESTLGRSESSLPTSTPPPCDDNMQSPFADQYRNKLIG